MWEETRVDCKRGNRVRRGEGGILDLGGLKVGAVEVGGEVVFEFGVGHVCVLDRKRLC